METPIVFLEDTGHVRFGAWNFVPEADRLPFDFGLLALSLLLDLVSAKPESSVDDDCVSSSLVLILGPPDTVIDEGFQLFRIAKDVTGKLAELTANEIIEAACEWHRKLAEKRLSDQPEQSVLQNALIKLNGLARRAEATKKSLFVEQLFR